MGRPKLSDEQIKETVGIKLPKAVISKLEVLGDAMDRKPSAVGRELLLLGLAVCEAARDSQFLAEILATIEALDTRISELERSHEARHNYGTVRPIDEQETRRLLRERDERQSRSNPDKDLADDSGDRKVS